MALDLSTYVAPMTEEIERLRREVRKGTKSMKCTFPFQAGRLLAPRVRHALDLQRPHAKYVRVYEQKSLVAVHFTVDICTSPAKLLELFKYLQYLAEATNSELQEALQDQKEQQERERFYMERFQARLERRAARREKLYRWLHRV